MLAASTPVHDVPAEPTPSDQGVDQANEICVPNCWLLQTCPRAIWAAWSHRGCVSLTQAVMLTSVPPTVSEGRHTKSAVPPGKLMLPADTVTAPPTVGVTGLVPPSLRAVPAALATTLFSGKPSPEAPISVVGWASTTTTKPMSGQPRVKGRVDTIAAATMRTARTRATDIRSSPPRPPAARGPAIAAGGGGGRPLRPAQRGSALGLRPQAGFGRVERRSRSEEVSGTEDPATPNDPLQKYARLAGAVGNAGQRAQIKSNQSRSECPESLECSAFFS